MNTDEVTLLGLDFGSTTSSALVARAEIAANWVTGRMELADPKVIYRSELVFTPFRGRRVDIESIGHYLERWLEEGDIRVDEIFAAGAILTGLAAISGNASELNQLLNNYFGEVMMAATDDPCLESWLAFMGSCSALSRYHPTRTILNLDIGGGTTNIAIGMNGNVLRTGCYFLGARHFQFRPGSYQLVEMSDVGSKLLQYLSIGKKVGDDLDDHIDQILSSYLTTLEAIVTGDSLHSPEAVRELHEQVPFHYSGDIGAITFSGGVAELIYGYASGDELPGRTHFGDLGVDLARRITESPVLAGNLGEFVPENNGRATVYGLTLHHTEVSGSSLFLPNPELLPLLNLPVVARTPLDVGEDEIQSAIALAARSRIGACVQISPGSSASLPEIRVWADRLARALSLRWVSPSRPLVVLSPENNGKAIGSYVTQWGASQVNLIVIDEIQSRHCDFVNIGRPRNSVVPVSFYGLRESS